MEKHNQLPGPYLELFDWIQEQGPETINQQLNAVQVDYALSVVEGIEAGKSYPGAAQNLRFLNELCHQLNYLVTDLNITK